MKFQAVKKFIINKLASELSPELYYHGVHHTLDVLESATRLAKGEGVDGEDLLLLRTACLYHDSGFLHVYKGHEEISCKIAKETLPDYGYSDKAIETISCMIMATQIPQSPKCYLAEILCDADLDYLGRDDFEPIAESLYKEMIAYKFINDEKVWNRIQVNFLGNHHYFTDTAKRRREKKKQIQLARLKQIVAAYED